MRIKLTRQVQHHQPGTIFDVHSIIGNHLVSQGAAQEIDDVETTVDQEPEVPLAEARRRTRRRRQ